MTLCLYSTSFLSNYFYSYYALFSVCIHAHVHVFKCLKRPEESNRYHRNRVKDSCKQPDGVLVC